MGRITAKLLAVCVMVLTNQGVWAQPTLDAADLDEDMAAILGGIIEPEDAVQITEIDPDASNGVIPQDVDAFQEALSAEEAVIVEEATEPVAKKAAPLTAAEVVEEKIVQKLERLQPLPKGYLTNMCGCHEDTKFDQQLDLAAMQNMRSVSNDFMHEGTAPSPLGISNMLWAFGQVVDHDLVGTVDDFEAEEYKIALDHPGETVEMTLHRLIAKRSGETECRVPITITTPQLDAGFIYSNRKSFLSSTLREPNGCKLRVTASEGNRDHLPLTGETDESNRVFFIAGDVRVNEHAVLTAMHTVFMREHNRLCDAIPKNLGICRKPGDKPEAMSDSKPEDDNEVDPDDSVVDEEEEDEDGNDVVTKPAWYIPRWGGKWGYGRGKGNCCNKWWQKKKKKTSKYKTSCKNAKKELQLLTEDEKFKLVRKVVRAKFQHIVVNEFLPAFGITKQNLLKHKPKIPFPTIAVEFATAGYRVGHDMIPDTMGDFVVKELFGGERYLLEARVEGETGRKPKPDAVLDDLLKATASTISNEIDGKFSDTIRNVLFGPQKGSMFGEDLATRSLFRGHDMGLVTYEEMCKCYGVSPGNSPMTGKVKAPFPLMLADNPKPKKRIIGRLLKKMLIDQFHRVLFGTGGQYYKARQLGPFLAEVQSTTLSKIINANSGADVGPRAFYV